MSPLDTLDRVFLDVMTLSSTDLRRTVSATGTVESAQSVLVYSTQSYAVQEVLVEVGDYVEAGQLMAKLDDGVILDQIESQEAALSASNSASSAAIAAAEHNYEQYKAALGRRAQQLHPQRESSVSNAYDNYVSHTIHMSGTARTWPRGTTAPFSARKMPGERRERLSLRPEDLRPVRGEPGRGGELDHSGPGIRP